MVKRYSTGSDKKKLISLSLLIKIIIGLILIVSIAGSAYYFVTVVNRNIQKKKDQVELKDSYKRLYTQKNYLELTQKMDFELKKSPFQVEYLIYRGFSYFFLGEDERDLVVKRKYFTASLVDLRKALALGIPDSNKPGVYLCIGKIYFYLGRPYYNLSIKFLNMSLASGNLREDLLYILALIYSHIGEYKNAVSILEKSLQIDESDIVLLAIGHNYYKANEHENAKSYFEKVIKISNNPKIKEKAYLNMGEIYFNQKKYTAALPYFNKVIEINDNNANAYFYKGEISFFFNDTIKARAQWRKTLEIDPSHIRARKRFY